MNLHDYIESTGRGALSRLAIGIGAHKPDVSRWASGERPVPAQRCPAIERFTNGAVTCEELRPDVDWAYLRGTAQPDAQVA